MRIRSPRRASARIDAHSARAKEVARQVAAELVRDHGASRVWLVGSLARGTAHARSDIDLVVDIEPGRLPAVRDWVAGRVVDFDVDVLAFRALPEGWRGRIERDGEPL
ncbi:MAG: nucleotidyltransferase family protein [Polyangiaceae bacterium]|jgi:predicted nucleotidyltransferase